MADADRQPLIGREDGEETEDSREESLVIEKSTTNLGLYVWLLTLSAGTSGLLFGCKCTRNSEVYFYQLLTRELQMIQVGISLDMVL